MHESFAIVVVIGGFLPHRRWGKATACCSEIRAYPIVASGIRTRFNPLHGNFGNWDTLTIFG